MCLPVRIGRWSREAAAGILHARSARWKLYRLDSPIPGSSTGLPGLDCARTSLATTARYPRAAIIKKLPSDPVGGPYQYDIRPSGPPEGGFWVSIRWVRWRARARVMTMPLFLRRIDAAQLKPYILLLASDTDESAFWWPRSRMTPDQAGDAIRTLHRFAAMGPGLGAGRCSRVLGRAGGRSI